MKCWTFKNIKTQSLKKKHKGFNKENEIYDEKEDHEFWDSRRILFHTEWDLWAWLCMKQLSYFEW